MLDWSANPNLDVFAAQIMREAERLRSLDEIKKPGRNNIAMQIAWFLGREYLKLAQAYSPVDTRLLQKSHRVGQPEFKSSSSGIEASVIIDITPDASPPTNVKWGGRPIDYGADYHAEKLQWFDLAAQAIEPLVDRLTNDMFNAYIEDLWNK